MPENQKNTYDINIQCQELNKGMNIEDILKVNLDSKQNTNTSWLVKTITEETNSKIRQNHFIVQENKRGSRSE